MKIEQLYTDCLAEAAYYIESNGEAAIIDPLRETEPYTELAEKNNVKIKYVFETHFHADFVSGHIDLAKKTGASIVFGPTATPGYDTYTAKDNEDFKIGDVTIRVLHTPGHTMESSTFLLLDENGKEVAIFTGDTLFLGDVGRPDLAVKSDLTREDLAAHLYDSLHNKILTLPDDVIVYPGHGAGSACGKNLSDAKQDTLGNQKKTNYALQATNKDEFIATVTKGLATPPQYFPKNVVMNKTGYESIDDVMTRGNRALTVEEAEKAIAEGAVILDVRNEEDFTTGFIPNSLFVGLEGMFAVWVGTFIIDLKTPILVVAPEGRGEETVMRLARVGYDNSVGYLAGGFKSWADAGKEVDSIESISVEEFAKRYADSGKSLNVVDVRKESEHLSEHIETVTEKMNIPVEYFPTEENSSKLDKDTTYYFHCAGGYRSLIACTILRQKGFKNMVNVLGGFNAVKESGLVPVTDYVCPSTFLE